MRPLYIIANEICKDWTNWRKSYAYEYIKAMACLDKIEDNYYFDSGREIVLRFLSNSSGWRGEKARLIKTELRAMIK